MRLALLVILALLTLPVVLLGSPGDVTSEAYDQNHHHLLAIHQFAEQLPSPDLRNYASATSPLWHLALSVAKRLFWCGDASLRLLNCAAAMLLVWVTAGAISRLAGSRLGAWLALPLVVSPYLLSGAIWITTDVPALTAITIALAAALSGAVMSGWIGLSAAVAVSIRQVSLWIEAPLAAALFLRRKIGDSSTVGGMAMALIPAVAVVAVLLWIWGGLTPPGYREMHDRGINPAATVLGLALAGVWCLPLMGLAMRELGPMFQRSRAGVIALLAGAACAVIVPTSFSIESGRWGGPLWIAVEKCGSVGERSLLLLVLAPLGAVCLCAMYRRACSVGRGQEASVLCLAIAAVVAANWANSQCWERYFDLPFMVLIPWLAAAGVERDAKFASSPDGRMLQWGAAGLAMVQLTLSIPMVYLPLGR